MRQKLLITRGGLLTKLSLLFAFLLVSATSWAASDEDYTELAFGEDATVVTGDNFYKFTTTKAGTVVVASNDGTTKIPQVYSDAAHSTKIKPTYFGGGFYASSANVIEFTAEANTTYYLYVNRASSSSPSSFTFQVNEDPDIKLIGITDGYNKAVTEGGTIDLTGSSKKFNAKLSFTFNRVLEDWSTTATVTAGSYSQDVTVNAISNLNFGGGNKITVDLYNTLTSLLSNGYLEDGGTFSITFPQLKTRTTKKLYGEDGTATFSFKVVGTPTSLTDSKVPEKFLSFWNKDDEDGKIVLTFSNNLSTTLNTGTATISYGESDSQGTSDGSTTETDDEPGTAVENYTEISLPVTIDGKTATVDLTGVYRSFATLLPGATISEPVAVNVAFPLLYDAGGSKIETGLTGQSSYKYTIEGIEEVTSGGFVPKMGSLVNSDEVGKVTFTLSHKDLLKSYDGFSFACTVGGQEKTLTVDAADVTVEEESDGSVVYTFYAPDEAVVASSATVTVLNPTWADGYAPDFSATYNYEFEMYFDAPEELMSLEEPDNDASEVELAGLFIATDETEASKIIIETNAPVQIGLLRFKIKDSTTGEYVLTETTINRVYDENYQMYYYQWTNEDPADYLFYKDHTYTIEVYAAVDAASADKGYWVGTASYNFTGTTKPYEYAEYTFVSVDPDPDDYVIESADERTFTVTFDGPVKVEAENSFVQLNAESEDGSISFESIVSSDGAEYSKVWTLTVSESTMEAVNDGLDLTVVAVGENGGRVTGDSKYFQGSEAQRYLLFSYSASFNVADVEVSPADGSVLDKIDEIRLSYYGDGGIDFAYIANDVDVKLFDAAGNQVARVLNAYADYPDDWTWGDDPATTVVMPLNTTITAAGEYTLVIPYGYVVMGQDTYAVNNKKTTVKYTIPEKVSVEIGETGYATLYYSDKALTVPADEDVNAWTYSVSGSSLVATKSYPAGSVIPAGEAVVLRTHEPGTYEFTVASTEASKVADNALKGTDEAVAVSAADGNKLYKLGVGSEGIGFYQVSEDGKSFTNEAHKAYLEVSADADAKFFSVDGTSTGISSINSEAGNNANIYNLQGQKLQNMNRSGLYIVGGKKVVVK